MSRDKEQQIIRKFGEAQQAKLDQRSAKGRLGWKEKDLEELLKWLKDEFAELEQAITSEPMENIKLEAVDVANLAMMIWNKVDEE